MENLLVYSPDSKQKAVLKKIYEQEGYSENVKKQILGDRTEILTVNIRHSDRTVEAFRSITSHYNLFYCLDKEKGLLLSDHMANILSYIPVDAREVDINGVMDSYLYQFNAGPYTPVKGVCRMGAGDRLCYQPGKLRIENIQKLLIGKYNYSGENGIRVLDRELSEAINIMVSGDTINTLSGGVDSALTQTYLKDKKTVSACYEHEAYLVEKEYALEAAKLLNTRHKVYMIPMENYLELLEEAVLQYGLPVYNMTAQALHYYLAKNIDNSHMLLSALAGVVYGQTVRKNPTKEMLDKYGAEDWNNWANIYGCQIAREDDLSYICKLLGKNASRTALEEEINMY